MAGFLNISQCVFFWILLVTYCIFAICEFEWHLWEKKWHPRSRKRRKLKQKCDKHSNGEAQQKDKFKICRNLQENQVREQSAVTITNCEKCKVNIKAMEEHFWMANRCTKTIKKLFHFARTKTRIFNALPFKLLTHEFDVAAIWICVFNASRTHSVRDAQCVHIIFANDSFAILMQVYTISHCVQKRIHHCSRWK